MEIFIIEESVVNLIQITMDSDITQTSSNQGEETQKAKENISEIKHLYMGEWADNLVEGQILKVGEKGAGKEPMSLVLDFNSFEDRLKGFSQNTVQEHYSKNKERWDEFIKSKNADIDPYLAYQCYAVLHHIKMLLDVDNQEKDFENKRSEIYRKDTTPKLSEFNRLSMCTERAVLAQFLFQKIGVKSSYVSGAKYLEPEMGTFSSFEAHSFIVLQEEGKKGSSLIFDPSDTVNGDKIPAILRTESEYSYDVLKDEEEICISATELFSKSRCGYGLANNSPIEMWNPN